MRTNTTADFNRHTRLLESGCILWTGAPNKNGYGYFRINLRSVRAHRFAYEQAYGPIPTGLVLDHLCRNRMCVNVAHLEVVTPQVNILRGVGTAAVNAKKTECLRGHPYADENTIRTKRGTRRCRTCERGRNR